MPGRITKRDDSATVSDDRVSSIRLELEQLLALGDLSESNGEIGTEVLNEKRREARKVLHKQKNENSKETNDDTDIKKRPKRTKRDRGIKRCSNRSSKESVNGLQEMKSPTSSAISLEEAPSRPDESAKAHNEATKISTARGRVRSCQFEKVVAERSEK